MAAGVGQRIDASDYASIKSKVDLVFGTGSGDTGYGQVITSPEVTPGTTISASNWTSLRADMVKARQHQTGVSVGSTNSLDGNNLLLPVAGDTITEELRNQYNLFSNTLTTNKFLVASGQLSATDETLVTGTRSTAWNSTLTHTVTITGSTIGDGSANNLRYFFNAGGSIKLTASRTGGSTTSKNTDWSNMLSTMGTIVFNYTQTTYTGSAGTGSAIGWYDLTTTNQVIFQQAGTSFTSNLYRVSARTNADRSQLILTIEFQDNDITAPDVNVDGNLVSTVLQSRPVGSNVEVRTNIASQVGLDSATPNPTPNLQPANVMFIMDVSGSMDYSTTYNGVPSVRLNVAKQVASDVLDCLVASSSQVSVRVIKFESVATALGTSWVSVSSAKSLINSLTALGGTNFIDATNVAQTAWESPGKLAGAKNYIYFISDGYQVSFDSTNEATWKSFLNSKLINSIAYGIGDGTLDLGTMNKLAWNGETQTGTDATLITSTISCSTNTQVPTYTIETIPAGQTTLIESYKWYKAATQVQWNSLLNTYGIWAGNATEVNIKTFTATFSVPTTGTYSVEYSSDDNMSWKINSGTTYISTYNVLNTAAVSLTAGTHTITVTIQNTGGPAAAAIRIFSGGTTYWTTLNQVGISTGNTLSFLVKSFNTPGETLYWNVTGAASPADFVNGSGSITINNGQATFSLTSIPDALVEGNENFQIEVRKNSNTGPIAVTSPTITLVDTTPIPTYTLTPSSSDAAVTVNETGTVTYTIGVVNGNGATLTWNIVGNGITASDFSDVNGITGTITVNSDNYTTTITKTLRADSLTEGAESFVLQLLNSNNVIVATSRITNVTDSSINLVFATTANNSSSAISVNEGTNVIFRTLTNLSQVGQTYYYSLTGSAATLADVNAVSGNVIFYAGTDSYNGSAVGTTTISITADWLTEGAENIRYNLYSDQARTILVSSSPLVTINDTSNGNPVYSITADATVNEGASPAVQVYIRNVAVNTPIYWKVVSGTASVPGDFNTQNGSISGSFVVDNFNEFLRSLFIAPLKNDNLTEGSETFYVALYTDSGYTNQVAITSVITVNDTSLTPNYSYTITGPSTVTEGVVASFTVTTTAPAGTTLRWNIPGSSYTDFQVTEGIFTVPSGGVSVINLLPLSGDGNDVPENYTLYLLNNAATQTLASKGFTISTDA